MLEAEWGSLKEESIQGKEWHISWFSGKGGCDVLEVLEDVKNAMYSGK